MNRARQYIAITICISFFLVSLLSAVLIAEHAGHDCHDEHCGICAVITHFRNTFKHLGMAAAAACAALAAVCCLLSAASFPVAAVRATPISLKVQMNH
jgi:hypothetical protein